MKVGRRAFLAAGVALAATARSASAQTPISSARVIMAVTASLPITVTFDSVILASDVPYGGVTDYRFGRPGPRRIYAFNPAELGALSPMPLLDVPVVIQPAQAHTVLVAGSALGGVYNAAMFVDDQTLPTPGRAHVRFINACRGATLSLDTPAGTLFENVPYLTATPYRPVLAGSYPLGASAQRITTLEQPQTVGEPQGGRLAPLPAATFDAGAIYSIVAIGTLARDPYLQLEVVNDIHPAEPMMTPGGIDSLFRPYLPTP